MKLRNLLLTEINEVMMGEYVMTEDCVCTYVCTVCCACVKVYTCLFSVHMCNKCVRACVCVHV